jgi:hypothetical protein
MLVDQNRIYDGWVSLEGGVDAGRMANQLDPNQVQSAINVSFRGGNASARPGFRRLDQKFPALAKQIYVYDQPLTAAPEHWPHDPWDWFHPSFNVKIVGEYAVKFNDNPDLTLSSQDVYLNGKMQCAIAYSPHNGEDCIVAMIGGRMFKIVPGVNDAQVREIRVRSGKDEKEVRNAKDFPIAYMCQADKWLIVQDGQSAAIIYDGTIARRSVTNTDVDHTEIPTGTIMAYGMGRLVVIVNERDVAFGDLYGSHNLPDPADSVILFTERNFLAEGFDAAIPFTQGIATGAMFFPQLDTSTGNGQLMVFAERGAASFFLSLPRELWKTSQFQILSLLTTGLRGHRSISVVNEDLWFRSDDGMRSYRQARSEQGGWAHIPLSNNVKQYFGNDSDRMLKYASSIYFDNRIITTTSPMWYQGRPMHWGLVSVDFDIISAFSGSPDSPQTSKPAWEGQWTLSQFIFPTQLLTGSFNGVTRAFLFGIDNNNQNQLFELSKDDKEDWDDQCIHWEIVTRGMDFSKLTPQASTPFNEVELYDGDLWLSDVRKCDKP